MPSDPLPKRALSRADLLEHLDEQVGFLRASCAAFDAGHDGEAKRIAVGLRVLLHDSKNSRSLLHQLGQKDVPFWDLSFPDLPGNLLPHAGLVATRFGAGGVRYVAQLDDAVSARRVSFENWWNGQVFRDTGGVRLSRKELILTAADQDGGAHVDPALDERYARFARDEAAGWRDGSTGLPIRGTVRVAIRQVAHEVLRTLDPRHGLTEKTVPLPPSMVADMARAKGSPRPVTATSPKVGRNDPCPCGSGRKFKKCHGASTSGNL